MFTGIIEAMGTIETVVSNGTNKTFTVSSSISSQLTPDQSVAHDGVCLTIEQASQGIHQVTTVLETLQKTNLATWQPGSVINLERCLQLNGRLDGHIVQGHVDATARCKEIKDQDGSYLYSFEFPATFTNLVIEKGSIAINGISLTIFDVGINCFSVAIIPYTYNHTSIQKVTVGSEVNIEFDMLGKYVNRILQQQIK